MAGQFKDHFYGDTPSGRFLGKTLFNTGEIKIDGVSADNVVAIGESSMKLKGGYKKYAPEEIKEVIIDGKKFTAIGEVEGTDTSFFKNAASDSYRESTDTTVSDSIKAKLGYSYAKAIEDIQIKEIEKAFENTIGSFKDFNIKVNSYASIDDYLNKVISTARTGIGTSSVV